MIPYYSRPTPQIGDVWGAVTPDGVTEVRVLEVTETSTFKGTTSPSRWLVEDPIDGERYVLDRVSLARLLK